MDPFLFDVTGLDEEAWSAAEAVRRLRAAAEAAGHTTTEEDEDGGWTKVRLAGPLPSATIMVASGMPAWALRVNDNVLGDVDEADEEAQGALVDLVTACVEAAPLYLGTAVWPFGQEVPPSYDTSGPFPAQQAGPLMYVSDTYVEEVLAGSLEPPRGWRSKPAGPGRLLVVDDNLLQEPDDPGPQRLLKRLRPRR